MEGFLALAFLGLVGTACSQEDINTKTSVRFCN